MKTRTFKGDSVHALMRQVRDELGDNVVILETRGDEQAGVILEVGLLEAGEAPEVEQPHDETSLSELADLYRDSSVESALELNGVCAELTARLLKHKKIHEPIDGLGAALSKHFSFNARLPFASRAVVVVGPTGAGKTTSIAKLTARLQEAFDIKVGLIGGDSYRVGADSHLAAFARLLGVPLAVIDESLPTEEQLDDAMERLAECDLILIDTPGVGLRDKRGMQELATFLQRHSSLEKLLTVPAPSNEVDLMATVNAYLQLQPSRMLVTKVDESGYLGPVLNACFRSKLPIGFIGTGQRVPEDIEPASPRRLAWMLMRRMH
jgi:flagellar biosynthesis GTPase FlhF